MKKDKRSRETFSFRAYFAFYSRFSIPWWLFLAALVFGLVNTEVVLQLAE